MVCSLFFVVLSYFNNWLNKLPTSYDPCGAPRKSGSKAQPCHLLARASVRTILQENHHEFIGGMFTYHSSHVPAMEMMARGYRCFTSERWLPSGELT